MLWIIAGFIFIVLLVMFARSTAREANRIKTEIDFLMQSRDANVDSINHLLQDNDLGSEKAEREAARYKARAAEVASRQSPLWAAYFRTVKKKKFGAM